MKTKSLKQREQAANRAWYRRCIIVVAMLMSGGATARADSSTNAPAVKPAVVKPAVKAPKPLTQPQLYEGGKETYNNWVDFSAGGLMTSGKNAQAQMAKPSLLHLTNLLSLQPKRKNNAPIFRSAVLRLWRFGRFVHLGALRFDDCPKRLA